MQKNLQKQTSQFGIAVCNLDATAALNGEIQLTPVGAFRANDGRPADAVHWLINDEIASAVIARASAQTNDMVLDYEHQTLRSKDNGKPAPAAGFFKNMEWRPDSGLWAVDVKLNDEARAFIEKGQYRYISPVFLYKKGTGEILAMLMAALTNNPAIDGMEDISSLAAANFQFDLINEESPMDEKLLKALGLPATATLADCTAAIEKLQKEAADGDTAVADLTSKLQAAADPAKFVPIDVVNDLQTKVAALTTEHNKDKVTALIAQGKADGKIVDAQVPWLTELGNKSFADLTSHLEHSVAIADLSKHQTEELGLGGGDNKGKLNAEQIAMCTSMGVSQEDYLANLEAQA